MQYKHLWIALGIGAAVGFYLANAQSGTGIYGTPVGQTLANIYVSGNNAGSGISSVAKT
jgi:hypothetical protein